MIKMKLIILSLILSSYIFAHEGHDMPGSMPPAPHGGEVKEAEHAEAGHGHHEKEEKAGHENHEKEEKAQHAHEKSEGSHDEKKESHEEEEAEIFFEVVYANKTVKVYPLTVSPKNPKIYAALPTNVFSEVSLKIELPRQKRTEILKVKTTDSYFEAAFDPKSVFRFFAHVSAKHENEEKKAKIQVEID